MAGFLVSGETNVFVLVSLCLSCIPVLFTSFVFLSRFLPLPGLYSYLLFDWVFAAVSVTPQSQLYRVSPCFLQIYNHKSIPLCGHRLAG
jgi:hypothetical protein